MYRVEVQVLRAEKGENMIFKLQVVRTFTQLLILTQPRTLTPPPLALLALAVYFLSLTYMTHF